MFNTTEVNELYSSLDFSIYYKYLNNCSFNNTIPELEKIKTIINDYKTKDETILNDLYVLKRVVDFYTSLSKYWNHIFHAKYSSSWSSLQDCLDLLRTIKRFSLDNRLYKLEQYENLLLDIEKMYPYRIFFSMGIEVGIYECSICHENIDSFDCPHEIGNLYKGKMAYAIAKEIANINHVSAVENPKDKRCVPVYEDNSSAFKGLQYIHNLLIHRHIFPTKFFIEISKRKVDNPEYKKIGKNKKCYCGSNKKFKRCCINKKYIMQEHFEIVHIQVQT